MFCMAITACDHSRTMPNDNSSLNLEDNQDMNNDFKLIINEIDITAGNYVYIEQQEKYAKIPLVAIAKSLGCDVKWHNNSRVTINFENTTYILNPTKKTLKKKGDTFNIIDVPPGTNHGGYYQIKENEFIVDSDSISHFIYLLGARITIDYDAKIIKIDTM